MVFVELCEFLVVSCLELGELFSGGSELFLEFIDMVFVLLCFLFKFLIFVFELWEGLGFGESFLINEF